jgi:hypothetical protein
MRNITTDSFTKLVLIFALLLGIWIRLTPAIQSGFPINDGGMFYSMIEDLQHNNYALPAFTSYNQTESIPFAYPPFPLYLAAILVSIFKIPVTQILLWMPALTSIVVMVTFYFLAKTILDSNLQAAFALMFFALIPRTISWFLMGGGLTRSFGQLFLMLTAISAYYLFTRRGLRYLVLTVLTGTLVVLSHPEAALHTIGLVLLSWYFKSRNKTAFLDGLIVAAGVILVSAVWWLPVLLQHGSTPFISAIQTGNYSFQAWIPLITFNFAEEPLLGVLTVIGLLGLFTSVAKHNYFFAAWFLIPFLLEPRSATWIMTMPLAMLAAIAVTDLLLPGLSAMNVPSANTPVGLHRSKISLLFLGYIVFYSSLGGYAFALRMATDHLSQADRGAMKWVSENTPAGGKFIVLTGAKDTMHDPVQEWFPALTGRTSVTTLQGREWTWGKKFILSIPAYQKLQNCISDKPECLTSHISNLQLAYDYIYISAQPGIDNVPMGEAMIDSIRMLGEYQQVYEKDGINIFQKTDKK